MIKRRKRKNILTSCPVKYIMKCRCCDARKEGRRKERKLNSIDTHLTQTPSSSAHSSHSNSKQSGHAASTTAMKIRETHRVVFMGSGGVGKTSLITQFMEGLFISTYKPTVEDYHRHNIKTPGKWWIKVRERLQGPMLTE